MAIKKPTTSKDPIVNTSAKPSSAPEAALPATAADNNINDLFTADSGVGFDEGVDAGAYALPFLTVLQGLSPQVQRGTPEHIPGAQPGMVLNTVTKRLYDVTADANGATKDQLLVSVVRRTHTFCRWNKREDGGGMLGEQDADVTSVQAFAAITPDDKGRRIDSEGKELTEHRNFYVQVFNEDGTQEPAIISMTKSQLKAAREWNTLLGMKSVRGPNGPTAISEIWQLVTVLRKNKKGDQWYGWAPRHHARHSDPAVYQEVRNAVSFAKEQRPALAQLAQLEPAADDGEM